MEKREYCMKETKVYPQSEADQDFAKLLKNIRTEEKVSLDQLAMGLMSASQLVKIENGELPPLIKISRQIVRAAWYSERIIRKPVRFMRFRRMGL